jgi:hypothetical protein
MTIEQLLDLPPEGLEAIPDAELEQMLSPYFATTRPASGLLTPANTIAPRRAPSASTAKASNKALLDQMLSGQLTLDKLKAFQSLMSK